MKTASISQTKNQLSTLIDQVRQGETTVITDHDRPVAKLVPAQAEKGEEAACALANLERKGISSAVTARPIGWRLASNRATAPVR